MREKSEFLESNYKTSRKNRVQIAYKSRENCSFFQNFHDLTEFLIKIQVFGNENLFYDINFNFENSKI